MQPLFLWDYNYRVAPLESNRGRSINFHAHAQIELFAAGVALMSFRGLLILNDLLAGVMEPRGRIFRLNSLASPMICQLFDYKKRYRNVVDRARQREALHCAQI
jgi:hypothetical protein